MTLRRWLRWLLRALWWLAVRLLLLALAALFYAGCLVFPWLRRIAWQTTLMAVGLTLTRRGGVVPRSRDGGQGGDPGGDRGSGNVPDVQIRPVSAQAVATSPEERTRYHVWGMIGPGLLTMLVGGSGMGKTELRFGLWRAQYDGEPFCGLATERGSRKLLLTEMERPLVRDVLRRWGFLVEPKGRLDRVWLNMSPRDGGAYVDVEYASRVFEPDEHGSTADWPAVLGGLVRRRVWERYDEACVDTFAEWLGTDANDHASAALGLCKQLTKRGMAVTVLHHTPLSDPTRQKGGMGVLRALDSLWALYGVGGDHQKRRLKDPERYLACLKLRRQEDAPDDPLRIELVPGDLPGGVLPRYRLVTTPHHAARQSTTGRDAARAPAPQGPILTDRQRAVLTALRRAPEQTATTPELATACRLDGDRTGETLKALAGKGLVAPAGTGEPSARGSKAPRRWRATPLAIAVAPPAPTPEEKADRLLREALDG